MKKIITLLFSCLLLLAPSTHANDIFGKKFDFLKGEPELMPVNEAFVFDAVQDGNRVRVSFVIADGYYLYRDKLKFEADNATLGEVALPPGKLHNDEYFGEQQVFYSYVEFTVALKEAMDQGTLTLTFMGCAEGKLCFPPTRVSKQLTAVAPNDGKLSGESAKPVSDGTVSGTSTSAPLTQQDSLAQMLTEGNLGWTLLIF